MTDVVPAPSATGDTLHEAQSDSPASAPNASVVELGVHPGSPAHHREEELKAELLRRAQDAAARTHVDDPDVPSLLRRYYAAVAPDDLLGRSPQDLLGAVVSHRRMAETRPQGTCSVRAFTPTDTEHGWATGHTIVEIVTDDMPFLVDSVTSELTREGRGIHVVIHPVLVVRRDLMGSLVEILDVDHADRAELPSDAVVESWMHVEIDRESERSELAAVEAALQRVLRDVRASVEDWPRMRGRALAIAEDLVATAPAGVDAEEVHQAEELLRWLADDNFTFLGYREYELLGADGEERLDAVPGTGLGILRFDQQQSSSFASLPPEVRSRAREPHVLVLTKANSRSTVHRPAYLDYVGVKRFDAEGNVVGERRFLGLLTASAYTQSVTNIPVLRERVDDVYRATGFLPGSHDGKNVLQFLETYPRDELFQTPAGELAEVATAVLHLQERRQTKLFLRPDDYGRFMSCLVYLPRDRYTTAVRLRIEAILREAFGGTTADYTARVSESVLARLHFVIRVAAGAGLPEVDVASLESQLVEATRNWQDDFADAMEGHVDEAAAARLVRSYAAALPEAYKEDFAARTGVADVLQLEQLGEEGTALNLYEPFGTDPYARRFKVYRVGSPVSLSKVLPVLQRMGIEVVDERPYEVDRPARPKAWIYDFGVRFGTTSPPDPTSLKERFEAAFEAAWLGYSEADRFNALVVTGGLTWRQALVLRAYSRYLRQAGSAFGQDYIESVVLANVPIARLLVQLFEARFDPDAAGDRDARAAFLVTELEQALDEVESLDHDRILRSFLALVLATLRTNYFQSDSSGRPTSYVSFKLDSRAIPDLPLPRPLFEIWVYSPRVEGVHLRFGRVARGGLRWSDRREDFRTEILGLVKAQEVKNAVIVPVGAKGGFYPKQLPDPAVDRDAWLAEGVASYRVFISALLDVTDNLLDGVVVPPDRVVRHDGDDPYLVVAADKGTATFSDIANGVAEDYGFWLGDAFASGGSAGYDHKAMGITARGAWESVKRHFRELGVDTQTQDFTVVGVGDMSGDVFGNGMLLSEHIRLVAAFDHRHIFIDPNPDAAASFAERSRLFALQRSSWADYDTSLISEGGGVFPRGAKSIPLTSAIRHALGIDPAVSSMTPQELMRAVLQAPVDLLWNGGIGTYVKAQTETNSDVGDKANDAIRVNGRDLRVRVVGEGGNLGMTQLGRVEAALNGVKLNTDAIDNSAGVDTSDHEVNIKILLDAVVRDGDLTEKQRNALLAQMTDEVGRLVLVDNYEQNVVLGNARVGAANLLSVHQRMIREMERTGILDRALEYLPGDEEIERRLALGQGLTSPELCVLLAYAKIWLTAELNGSGLADDPWFARSLRSYFPKEIVERYEHRLDAHPLREEIITTVVVNELINNGGGSFVFRAVEETGARPVEVVRAATAALAVFDLVDFWYAIDALDNQVPTQAQVALYLESRRLLDRATRWFLQTRGGSIDVAAEVDRFRDIVARLAPTVPGVLVGVEQDRLQRRASEFEALGAPRDMAVQAAGWLDVFSLLDIVEVALRTGEDPSAVLALYFVISERYEVDKTLTRITALPRDDRWSALARQALRSDLYSAIAGLTSRVIRSYPGGGDPLQRLNMWEANHAEGLARAKATLDDIAAQDHADLATLSVALRVMRNLVAQGGSSVAMG